MSGNESTSADAAAADSNMFTVMIVASSPTRGGGLVHAVAVNQPVQSWTVLRSNQDFANVAQSLVGYDNIPVCPVDALTVVYDHVEAVLEARNQLQTWLSAVLTMPGGARESPVVRNFLTLGANTIAPQYENLRWTHFNVAAVADDESSAAGRAQNDGSHRVNNVDDMEMDEMFMGGAGDDDDHAGAAGVGNDDRSNGPGPDDDYIPSASERYKECNEQVTDEDMDILQLAGEVEMVEDIGSLAQSLGASHLGRSLQLQQQQPFRPNTAVYSTQQQQGLSVSGSSHGQANNSSGGLGSAMANAGPPPLNMGEASAVGALHARPPTSAPRLDSFQLIRVIGKGSFGKVFLVKEHQTSQIYALKVLRKDNIIKRNQVEHTKTERSVLGLIRHPFIVGMNMAFQSKDKLYFVLDYCAGGELFFHLGKLGKFPEGRAKFYASEITLAISYVHSLEIVYRDLKPENVLLDADGHIRLTDFGLSKEGITGSSSGANSFCGTPEYLAPEILNRKGHGRAVDWWSLGALLYEMITGLPPFYCQDRERLFDKIRKSELHYPASVSRPAKSLLKGLLCKDPAKRLGSGPTDADELKNHDFFADIDWQRLSRGELPPPWRPDIRGSLDTSQFDSEFTRMPVCSPESLQRSRMPSASGNGTGTNSDMMFENFTFTGRGVPGMT